ncbi:MAG: amidophosphoribosyltransferase [Verrucomicrobiota bacterium]|nr:amidophosphoribosyltransferase [Opitutae bacterium]MEC7393261.1 amidophosphoribosyltransferase [Verrucomicrobiota bacterium]MEC8655088.1 amidophosphoribosyltransferase [Verrucomicrobiota bacterium]MEC8865585.1 amidophosphoribosyltransferase [Verrucomicrobiota bacterium]|tara:strand:- start:24813 stop:26732 length:1920 start_codon:yes stop_codon:yes gene_type:complete
MSDEIGHHCGIALVRLKKPLAHYSEKYGTALWGFNQLFLLMEKQHNRGQDGAGIGSMKLNMPPGEAFMFRERSTSTKALTKIFGGQHKSLDNLYEGGKAFPEFPETIKEHFDYGGEILLGHLRYGTSGAYGSTTCHPYFRKSNWPGKNLMVAGNFNLTNVDFLNQKLVERGQHPVFDTDTQAILEETGYHLDGANDLLSSQASEEGVAGEKHARWIGERIHLPEIFRKAAAHWDGGYALAGIIGNGDAFAMRDPLGIRPGFFFEDDEVVAVASERAPLMTVFDKEAEEIDEIKPGTIVVARASGEVIVERFADDPARQTGCSFERIYFSRGNDPDIYAERKTLGALLVPQVIESVGGDFSKSVFSYVPNTAESAYYGFMEQLRLVRRAEVKRRLMEARKKDELTDELINELVMDNWPVGEKIANKDIKLRTFISQESGRAQLVSHVYDITYGVVREKEDALVCIDDSIVRGTTLKRSILKILGRSKPRKLLIASTAPQIRYPDCYGIDMSELGKFIAFQAAVALIKERGYEGLLAEVAKKCREALEETKPVFENQVKRVYENFEPSEISAKVAELVKPKCLDGVTEVEIIYQSIENLHEALPDHSGDWYFTGDYPTPGGYRVAHKAFLNYYENKDGRSY